MICVNVISEEKRLQPPLLRFPRFDRVVKLLKFAYVWHCEENVYSHLVASCCVLGYLCKYPKLLLRQEHVWFVSAPFIKN